MCWTLNHQNILEMAQRHISLSVSASRKPQGLLFTQRKKGKSKGMGTYLLKSNIVPINGYLL
jgi:hypothetical protein